MSVYVDNMFARLGRMRMSHMIADTTDELLDMAERVGVDVKHIQHQGTYKEHFDICKSKRTLAILEGAIPLPIRELGLKLRARRGK